MKQETQELKNLPLSFLISAPLNAAIEAQRASALSTAAFIEQVGFLPKDKKLSLFADKTNTYDVRQAVVSYEQDEIKLKTPSNPGATPPTSDVYEVVKGVKRTLQLPFISLLNIPMFEVSELNIDFNVRLKGITQFEAEFNNETSSTVGSSASASGDLGSLGIPLSVGASMKVETTSRSEFGLRYGEGHEAEYNLHVTVKAVQAAQPKGIERLLALAEKIVDASEKANAELTRLNTPA
jgi:hypothetical protein